MLCAQPTRPCDLFHPAGASPLSQHQAPLTLLPRALPCPLLGLQGGAADAIDAVALDVDPAAAQATALRAAAPWYSAEDRMAAALTYGGRLIDYQGPAFIIDPVTGAAVARGQLLAGVQADAHNRRCTPFFRAFEVGWRRERRDAALPGGRSQIRGWSERGLRVTGLIPLLACGAASLQIQELLAAPHPMVPSSWRGATVLVPLGRDLLMLGQPGEALQTARQQAQQHAAAARDVAKAAADAFAQEQRGAQDPSSAEAAAQAAATAAATAAAAAAGWALEAGSDALGAALDVLAMLALFPAEPAEEEEEAAAAAVAAALAEEEEEEEPPQQQLQPPPEEEAAAAAAPAPAAAAGEGGPASPAALSSLGIPMPAGVQAMNLQPHELAQPDPAAQAQAAEALAQDASSLELSWVAQLGQQPASVAQPQPQPAVTQVQHAAGSDISHGVVGATDSQSAPSPSQLRQRQGRQPSVGQPAAPPPPSQQASAGRTQHALSEASLPATQVVQGVQEAPPPPAAPPALQQPSPAAPVLAPAPMPSVAEQQASAAQLQQGSTLAQRSPSVAQPGGVPAWAAELGGVPPPMQELYSSQPELGGQASQLGRPPLTPPMAGSAAQRGSLPLPPDQQQEHQLYLVKVASEEEAQRRQDPWPTILAALGPPPPQLGLQPAAPPPPQEPGGWSLQPLMNTLSALDGEEPTVEQQQQQQQPEGDTEAPGSSS